MGVDIASPNEAAIDWSNNLYFDDRLILIEKTLSSFLDFYSSVGINCSVDEDAAFKINCLYFHHLYKTVKPCVPTHVRRYKIASISDLAVNQLRPIKTNGTVDKFLNAKYGMHLSMCILSSMYKLDNIKSPKIRPTQHADIMPLVKHHLDWMKIKRPDFYPIFSNSSFYFLICKYLLK